MGKEKFATVKLEYQNLIDKPPASSQQLYDKACSGDKRTIDHWYDTWIKNIKANKQKFGSFSDKSIGQLFGTFRHMPAIVAGAGPSLKNNAHILKDRGDIPLVSCLHNFHFLEDLKSPADFYITLDAGTVTIEEVTEGGSRSEDEYWDITKDRTLIAYVGTDPKLLEKWKGKLYFFNAPVPSPKFGKELEAIERFNCYLSSGGNVLGSCLYFSKAILGCYSTIFVGADFSFGYPEVECGETKNRFHSWNSKYDDKLGKYERVPDIYGNKIPTWPSYYNFKAWFDWVTINVPGDYYNCSEGGCLGAYPDGNIKSLKYMDLEDALTIFKMSDQIKASCEDATIEEKKVLF